MINFLFFSCVSNDAVSSIEKTLVFDTILQTKCETAIFTLRMCQNKNFSGKIQTDNKNETPFVFGVLLNELKDDLPRFIFGKDNCSVNYYKNGLLWTLKDANGNVKILFKLSFDQEIYVGDVALEHPEFLMPEIDLEVISTTYNLNESAVNHDQCFLDETKEYKLLLNTIDGTRKTTSDKILAIFMKSILKLLEQKFLNRRNLFRCFSRSFPINHNISSY